MHMCSPSVCAVRDHNEHSVHAHVHSAHTSGNTTKKRVLAQANATMRMQRLHVRLYDPNDENEAPEQNECKESNAPTNECNETKHIQRHECKTNECNATTQIQRNECNSKQLHQKDECSQKRMHRQATATKGGRPFFCFVQSCLFFFQIICCIFAVS
jgi:hypothetical protein